MGRQAGRADRKAHKEIKWRVWKQVGGAWRHGSRKTVRVDVGA